MTSPLRCDARSLCGVGGVCARMPIHMHIAQEENLNRIPAPSRHKQCDTGIDITQAATSLSAMKKVRTQGWNPWDQVLPAI